LPLTEQVSFSTVLQKGNRIQTPRLIRWQFKLEPQQVLKVTVNPEELGYGREEFYSHMSKDGCIAVPKLTLKLLQGEDGESLVGSVLEVKLELAEGAS
jgi:hypothetical protein